MTFDHIKNAFDKYIAKALLRTGFYRKAKINTSNGKLLENKNPYIDPACVSFDYNFDNASPTCDISLIIPLYNSEKYLVPLYNMLSRQKTNYKYEIILVDDGSTDNTYRKAVEIVGTNKIYRCYSKPNGGISSARNYGIQRSKGKYIGFMDHDDVIDSEYIQKLLDAAYKNKAEIVRCFHGNIRNGMVHSRDIAGGYIWGGVYARRIFQYVRFPEKYWYEDMITGFLLIPQSRKTMYVNETLYYKVSHNNNAGKILWNSQNSKCIDDWYLIKSLCDSYTELGLDNKEYLFKNTLNECGGLLAKRVGNIDVDCQIQIFVEAHDLLIELYSDHFELDKKSMRIFEIFKKLDFSGWKLMGKCY